MILEDVDRRIAPKRVSDGLEWITDVCRRFSDATGWPLTYTPLEETPNVAEAAEGGPRFDDGPDCCWSADVRQSSQPIGVLHIDLPRDPGRDRSFLAVCDLGNLLANLLSQILTFSDSLERKSQDLSVLLNVEGAINNADAKETLQDYLRAVAELSRFWAAAFFLLSPDAQELRLRLCHRVNRRLIPRPERALADMPPDLHALRDGSITIQDGAGSVYADWLPEGFATGHCVRVDSDSGPSGVLWLFDRRRKDVHPDEDVMIRSFGRRIGTVLERVVLLRESAVHHRQNHDLQMASLCQREADADSPLNARYRAFEVAAVCTSRFELGGDLCDVVPLGDDRAAIVVGDASGDSVPAAMVMSAVRGAIRAIVDASPDASPQPDDVVTRVNRTLCGLSATHQFMSLFLGVLDVSQGTLTYANAGHPSPLLLRDGEAAELPLHDLLLGVLPDATYAARTETVRAGDVLVVYTDGIHEAMNADGRIFGTEGLRQALRGIRGKPAEEILTFLSRRVDEHSAGSSKDDDRTLLVLRLVDG